MSKKFKVVISVLVAVLLLTFSGTAVALAQDEPVPQTGPAGLLAKVAGILGVSQGQLVAAFQQARQEIRDECQATGNCTTLQARARSGEQWTEKRQQGMEKRQEMGRGVRGNRNDNQHKMRWRIAELEVGQQTIAVPESWNDQVLY